MEGMDYARLYSRTLKKLHYDVGRDGHLQPHFIKPEQFNGLSKIVGNNPFKIFFYEKKAEGPKFVAFLPLSTSDEAVSGEGRDLDEAVRQLVPQFKKHPGLIAAYMGFYLNPENYLQFIKGKR